MAAPLLLCACSAGLTWPPLTPAAPRVLQQLLQTAGDAATQPAGAGPLIAMCGHVRARRSLGRNLAFVDIEQLGMEETEGCGGAIQAILRSTNGPEAAPRAEVIALGARVALLGRAKLSPRGSQLLVALESQLLTAAPSEHGVRAALAALAAGSMTATGCARALMPAYEHTDQGEGQPAQSHSVEYEQLYDVLSKVESGDVGAIDDLSIDDIVRSLRVAAPPLAVAAACGMHPELSPDNIAPEVLALDNSVAQLLSSLAEGDLAQAALRQGELGSSVAETIAATHEGAGGPFDGVVHWIVVEAEVRGRRRLGSGTTLVDLEDPLPLVNAPCAIDDRQRISDGTCQEMHSFIAEEVANSTPQGDTMASKEAPLLRAAMHPSLCDMSNTTKSLGGGNDGDELVAMLPLSLSRLNTYRDLAAAGSRLLLKGTLVWPSLQHDGNATTEPHLLVTDARLVRCASEPKTVRRALEAIVDGTLREDEGWSALFNELGREAVVPPASGLERVEGVTADASKRAAAFRARLIEDGADAMRWQAVELSAALQRLRPSPSLGRSTLLADEEQLLADHAQLRARYPISKGAKLGEEVDADAVKLPSYTDASPPSQPVRGSKSRATEASITTRPASRAGRSPPLIPRAPLRVGRAGSAWSSKKRPQVRFVDASGSVAAIAPSGLGEDPRGRSLIRSSTRGQVEFLSHTIEELLRRHPEWGRRPLHVLEIAGGKGGLARHLAEALGEDHVLVTLIDVDAAAVATAARGAPANLRCIAADASRVAEEARLNSACAWVPTSARSSAQRDGDAAPWYSHPTSAPLSPNDFGVGRGGASTHPPNEPMAASGALSVGDVDLVVGLHACGGLSDLIVALAVDRAAAFCLCPCCYLSHPEVRVPAFPANVSDSFDANQMIFSDDAKQGMRPGLTALRQPPSEQEGVPMDDARADPAPLATRVERDRWLGVSKGNLRPLLKLAELQGNPDAARTAAHSVNAIRAQVAERRWREARGTADNTRLVVELRSFEAKYSPRNLCMIGQVVLDSAAATSPSSPL